MLLPIKECGKGVNKDVPASELAPGVWSDALNIEFDGVTFRRRNGIQPVYNTPTAVPYFLLPYITASKRFMVQAGLATVFVDDGTTRTDITGTAPTGVRANRWTGGDFGGVLGLNNGVDPVMYWNGDTATDLATLPAWPTGYKADTLRPFLSYWVAGGITKAGVKYPQLLMWSDAAEPGAIPTSFVASDTNQAGDDPMTGKGAVVDMLPYGSVNIIYCRQGRVSMRYIGGNDVFAFDPMPGTDGLLAPGCVVETPKGHVFLSSGDVLIHNGGEATSIAEDRIRAWLFATIDSTNVQNAFLTANPQKSEVWICFPMSGSTDCDRAAVWNWISDTWSIYDLPNVTYGTSGLVASAISSGTFDSDSDSFDSDVTSFDQNEYSPNEGRLVVATSTPKIGLANTGSSDFGTAVSQLLERTGIKPSDADEMLVLHRSRWPVTGTAGTTMTVYHGVHKRADDTPTYAALATHTQGTSDWLTRMTKRGYYLAIKITSTSAQPLVGRSLMLEYVTTGRWG